MHAISLGGSRTMTKFPRIPAALAVAVALAVLVSVAAGTSAASSQSSKAVTLSLVAYSTPKAAYSQLIPAFQATPAGQGVKFKPELRRLGRPGARDRAGPADRRRQPLARARHRHARAGAPRLEELEPHEDERHRDELDRHVPGAQGQPEEPPHLGRPGQARRPDRAAEPDQLGRRALGRDGGVRPGARAGEDPGAGADLPERVLQEHRRAGQERP